jgi:hypothetical protein
VTRRIRALRCGRINLGRPRPAHVAVSFPTRIDVPNTTQLYYFDDVEHATFDGVVVVTTTQRIYVRNEGIT